MKIRKLKHRTLYRLLFMVQTRQFYQRWEDRLAESVSRLAAVTGQPQDGFDFEAFWDDLVARQAKRSLVEGDPDEVVVTDNLNAVHEAAVEFVCARVKDGVVVDTFDTREAALALVKKHAKQKKAKLHVMDSSTGELILFSEEEMA